MATLGKKGPEKKTQLSHNEQTKIIADFFGESGWDEKLWVGFESDFTYYQVTRLWWKLETKLKSYTRKMQVEVPLGDHDVQNQMSIWHQYLEFIQKLRKIHTWLRCPLKRD